MLSLADWLPRQAAYSRVAASTSQHDHANAIRLVLPNVLTIPTQVSNVDCVAFEGFQVMSVQPYRYNHWKRANPQKPVTQEIVPVIKLL